MIRFEDAAPLLRDKGRRSFEVTDDFEDESGQIKPDIELAE